VAKHRSHIVLKVFHGFWPLMHLLATKNLMTEHCSSLVQTESGAPAISSKAVMLELAKQCQTCTEIIRRKLHKTTVLLT
jgi:hypothetical protein